MSSETGMLSAKEATAFRTKLAGWYRLHARKLPWRGIRDAYRTWVSEVMLQQTRVAAALDHYSRFLNQFPTVAALAEAPEDAVLATWSGLGYYRRARMMHRAAQLVVSDLSGIIPTSAAELRELPGIGDYTCAAIASIAFGESVPVVDGNVERVLLRVTGRPADPSSAGLTFIRSQASALMPQRRFSETVNAAGDHNQAMMELGATICLPRAPLCLNCPVYSLCRTRGEHPTVPRGKQRVQRAAYLLTTRNRRTELLLVRRDPQASLMPGMLELPTLPLDAVDAYEPVLRLRHSITNTSYQVEIYQHRDLMENLPFAPEDLLWTPLATVSALPLTGLARKVVGKLAQVGPEDNGTGLRADAS